MSGGEFPAELVERCKTAAENEINTANDGDTNFELIAITVLRASKHAELVAALKGFIAWSEAYPLGVFPEPDLKRAHELLKAGGMTLDAISASIMRKTVGRIGERALAALKAAGEK